MDYGRLATVKSVYVDVKNSSLESKTLAKSLRIAQLRKGFLRGLVCKEVFEETT